MINLHQKIAHSQIVKLVDLKRKCSDHRSYYTNCTRNNIQLILICTELVCMYTCKKINLILEFAHDIQFYYIQSNEIQENIYEI